MSTTTNFKRIALVAVAALGLGVLSTVPSSAAVSSVTTTVVNGASTLRASSTTLVDVDTGLASGASVIVSALITAASDSVTVAFFNKNTASATGAARLVFIDTQTSNLSRVSKAGLGNHSAATAVGSAGFDTATAANAAGSSFALNSSSGTGVVGARFAIILDTATATAGAGTNTYTVVTRNTYTPAPSVVVGGPTVVVGSIIKDFPSVTDGKLQRKQGTGE
jgi:hypothetical protein